MTDEDPRPIDEFDRVFAESYVRNKIEESILGIGGSSTSTVSEPRDLTLDAVDALALAAGLFGRPGRERLFDLPMVDLVVPDPRDDLRRFRLESMFPTHVYYPRLVVNLDFDRGPSRHDFWNTLKFFASLIPIPRGPKRRKARRRFKVAGIKRRNGWKKHLRKRRRA